MLVVMIDKLELWVILFFQTPPHLSTDNPVFKNKKKKYFKKISKNLKFLMLEKFPWNKLHLPDEQNVLHFS